MRRREFITVSCLAGISSLGNRAAAEGPATSPRQLLELRLYRLASQAKQDQLSAFFRDAAAPALNRAGIGPVGLFAPLEDDVYDVYALLPHNSIESVITSTAALLGDKEYLQAGEAFLSAPLKDPAYARLESSLLLAFDQMPKLEVPTKADSRIFQLRIYESHNVEKGQRKVQMFNEGGEIAIFRRVGLRPVFFGEALIGTRLPNLTYMLGFDDQAASDAAWDKFRSDAEWKKLRADPTYKETVSNITNIFMRPVTGSQI